jgi:YidC/Oxa1 family membrane protein insertase
VAIVDGYEKQLGLNKFELLIDWGWFYFITKPMFWSIDWIYRHVGNFGVAILLITVIIKGFFFPLANKSYASMAKMKAVQPEMMAIRERKTLLVCRAIWRRTGSHFAGLRSPPTTR